MGAINPNYKYLIELVAAQLHGDVPPEKPSEVDFAEVFEAAKFHSVANIAYYAAERLQQKPDSSLSAAWAEVRDKAIVKDIIQQSELSAICEAFEHAQMRYLPLKGSILKSFYPQSDYRTMTDIDILLDSENVQAAGEILLSLGYKLESVEHGIHDVYFKPPVMNVELHRELMGEEGAEFEPIFSDPWSMCLQAGCRCEFMADYFFAYILAHAIRHYNEGGTGIRSFADIYICRKTFGCDINIENVLHMMEKCGSADIAKKFLSLSEVWFDGAQRTEDVAELERFILSSGAYGTYENSAESKIQKKGRAGYILSLIFPRFGMLRQQYPILKKAPVMLPFVWLFRLVTKPFVNFRQNKVKLKSAIKNKKAD